MKTLTLFLFLSSLTLIAWTCRDEPNNPPPPPPTVQDTTSHDYSFEITYLGDGQSYLKDVAAVSDSDVWVTGQITINDSTGKLDGANPFNAAHWGGKKWELIRVPVVDYKGRIVKVPINCVYAFASNDVWMFSEAGSYVHWNGKEWKSEWLKERWGGILRIWGTSSNDLFFAGTNGNITHYDGKNFKKMESGIPEKYRIRDIYGVKQNSVTHAWVVASVLDQLNSMICYYNSHDDIWKKIWWGEGGIGGELPFRSELISCYPIDTNQYFVLGSPGVYMPGIHDLYEKSMMTNKSTVRLPFGFTAYPQIIRGTKYSNVFLVGQRRMIHHYNGKTWKYYEELYDNTQSNDFSGISFAANKIFVAGWSGNRGMLVIGSTK